jgi:hypothetical protein
MKYLLSFLFVSITCLTGNAQLNLGPNLEAKKYVVDYGTIKQGAERERVWLFTNSGTQPLVITNTEGSCGCTVPSKPDRPIPPGKEGEIKINYDTQRLGDFEKTVTITTNEQEGKDAAGQPIYKTHRITVKGKVIQ